METGSSNKYLRRRFAIFLTAFMFAGLGIGLLTHAYFIAQSENTPAQNVQGVTAQQQKTIASSPQNLFIPITSNAKSEKWGDLIESSFSPAAGKSRTYISFVQDSVRSVGFIDNQDNFFELYKVPLTTKLIQVYSDESISYVETKNSFGDQSLVLRDAAKTIDLLNFNLSERNLISYIFDNNTKSFYMSFVDKDTTSYISIVFLDGKEIKSISLAGVKNESEIVSLSENRIFLRSKDKSNCYDIDLVTKIINDAKCPFINSNIYYKTVSESKNGIEIINTQDSATLIISNAQSIKIKYAFYDYKDFYFLTNALGVNSIVRVADNSILEDLDVKIPEVVVENFFIKNEFVYLLVGGSNPRVLVSQKTPERSTSSGANVNYSNDIYAGWSLLNSIPESASEIMLLASEIPIYSY